MMCLFSQGLNRLSSKKAKYSISNIVENGMTVRKEKVIKMTGEFLTLQFTNCSRDVTVKLARDLIFKEKHGTLYLEP